MRSETIVAIAGGIIFIILLMAFTGGWMMGPGHMWGWNDGRFAGWWALPMLLMVLFWAAIIAAAVIAVRWLAQSDRSRDNNAKQGSDRSLEILRERYARGEISREEYEQMRKDLES